MRDQPFREEPPKQRFTKERLEEVEKMQKELEENGKIPHLTFFHIPPEDAEKYVW